MTIKDKNGNKAFYTGRYVKKDEALEFKPKLGSFKKKLFSGEGFSPFTVKKSTFTQEWLSANFPEALQSANP